MTYYGRLYNQPATSTHPSCIPIQCYLLSVQTTHLNHYLKHLPLIHPMQWYVTQINLKCVKLNLKHAKCLLTYMQLMNEMVMTITDVFYMVWCGMYVTQITSNCITLRVVFTKYHEHPLEFQTLFRTVILPTTILKSSWNHPETSGWFHNAFQSDDRKSVKNHM